MAGGIDKILDILRKAVTIDDSMRFRKIIKTEVEMNEIRRGI